MTDQSNLDINDEQQTQHLDPNIRGALKKLGTETNRANEAEQKAAALELQIAVRDAGIPETPVRELFLKSYDGPANAEAIKAEAEKYGLFAQQAPQDNGVSQAELNAQRQVVGASVGGQTPAAGPSLEEALRSAKSPAEVMAIVAQAERTNPEARIVTPAI